jgi:hypothetical protein
VGDPQLLKDWKFWVLFVGAVATLALLFVNRGVADGNRESLKEVTERQAFINDTIRISNFSAQFIQSLAQIAARTGDADIRQVLADHGVTFTVDEATQPAAAAGAEEPEASE